MHCHKPHNHNLNTVTSDTSVSCEVPIPTGYLVNRSLKHYCYISLRDIIRRNKIIHQKLETKKVRFYMEQEDTNIHKHSAAPLQLEVASGLLPLEEVATLSRM